MKLFSKYSNIRDHDTSTSKTDGQTDRRTDERLAMAIQRSAVRIPRDTIKNIHKEQDNESNFVFDIISHHRHHHYPMHVIDVSLSATELLPFCFVLCMLLCWSLANVELFGWILVLNKRRTSSSLQIVCRFGWPGLLLQCKFDVWYTRLINITVNLDTPIDTISENKIRQKADTLSFAG